MSDTEMSDTERKQKAGRMMSPDALALPHIIESIAKSISNRLDFDRFLQAVPRSLWTPAVVAFRDVSTAPSLGANWPDIVLNDIKLPPSVLALLAATLPLRPRIQLRCPIRQAAPLASLVAAAGPSLSNVDLDLNEDDMTKGQGRAISNLLLQRCPRLRQVSIRVVSFSSNVIVELNDLLAVITHPHVEDLSVNVLRLGATPRLGHLLAPRLGHLLAAWLSTAPATKLDITHPASMDDSAAIIAFCDALQANTTLQELTISDVPSFGGFHGRTLPVSLKRFEWNMGDDEVVDAATLTDLATAVGPTQLQHLFCNSFAQLATCPAAAPMLSQLQSLVVYQIDPDTMEALIAGVASVPALTSLELAMNDESSTRTIERLMSSLVTTCVHLQTLHISADAWTRERLVLVLSGVLELPQLTSLLVTVCLFEVVHVLPELVAAGRQLTSLCFEKLFIEREDLNNVRKSCRSFLRALARVPDVPFVLQNPSRVDAFVGNALGPRSDPHHQCRLDTGIYR